MEVLEMPVGVAVPDASAMPLRVEARVLTTLAALESALGDGLQRAWQAVVESDSRASAYQAPAWCVAWYRAYADAFDPFVVVIRADDAVVGVVPMAVDRASRRLVFAGHTMADYRDIVAHPAYRLAVTRELVRAYLAAGFRNPLEVGWIDPASDTVANLEMVCGELGLRSARRHQPCWRWFPAEGENLQKKFSRVKTHLNHFKRQGSVTFDVVTGPEAWEAFRDEFVRQHSLRQLQAARDVSFDDPRKQALYNTLFASPDVQMHVTACRVNGRMISGHVGLVWRGVLMLGAPSISIEDEQRSPAVILMAWIIQNADALGLKGFDLTIGESEFKRRLGNQCVQLTTVEIYANAAAYYMRQARARVVASARQAADRIAGPGAWEKRVKPFTEALSYKRRRLAELGPLAAITKAIGAVSGSAPEVVLRVSPRTLSPDGMASACDYDLHDNTIEDLLLWNGTSPSTAAAIGACARAYGRNRGAEHTLHTLVAGGTLAAWCYAHTDRGSGATVVYDIGHTPEFADRGAAETVVRRVVARAFASGSGSARIVLLEQQRALRSALGAAGFRVGERD